MSKPKVIQMIHGMSIGGAETLVKNYCVLFDRKKIDIVLVCLANFHSIYDKELEELGIKVVYIYDQIDRIVPGPKIVKRAFHRILGPFMTRRCLRQLRPDVLHTHLPINGYVKFAGLSSSVCIMHTIHTEPDKLWFSGKGRKKDFKAAKWLVRHYHMRFIVLHEKMRKEINNMFGVLDSVILKNGIDVRRFQNAGQKEDLREQYSVPAETFVVGHIGRFSEVKNHRFLVEIFAEIYKRNRKAMLWLIGTGALQRNIKDKVKKLGIEDRVVFWNTRDDIPKLLRMTDIIIMPSYYEGLSVTLIEAQISGVPSLVSDTVEQETAISNLITFYCLKKGPAKWADKALEIYQKGIEPVYTNLENWDIEKVVRRLENIYLEGLK